ncbi:hypothetical protein FQ142_00530 [Microbacterium sp. ANT_H45B]|uniref:hypothetical protein n=1 Tax=Microbacterium TaxID=33882 RepID=UPI0011F00989|nr:MULTISPECIES: hypothetical protein [Microbacterium]KAA0961871.1 hypothetical protein FQ142_00530 [Microbacterium sp. ANT_H45B]MCP1428516.1 SdpC family antimicrobial peptide [Microbacterium foliorum]
MAITLKKRTTAAIGVAAAVALGAAVVTPPAIAAEIAPASEGVTATDSGRDLFSAMYFGVGDMAAQFDADLGDPAYSAFRESVGELGPDLAKVEGVLDALEAKDADVFADFHTEMTSGDVLRVEAEFVDAAEALSTVSDELNFADESEGARVAPGDVTPMAVVPVFVVWVAVAEAAGAVHALTLAVQMNLAWTENVAWSAAGSTGLETEKGIVGLTETLDAY